MTAAAPPPVPPPPPTPPPPGLTRSPLSDGEWQRMHPLTPLLRGGLALVVIGGLVISNLRERIVDLFVQVTVPDAPDLRQPGDPIDFVLAHNLVIVALLIVLAVILVLVGLFWLSWRFHTFRITGEHVEVRHGVLFRSHRRAPLDRVQGVNLTRPLVARMVGMAKLEVVGAGTDSNVKLEYLSTPNAEAVRADILRLASGRKLAEAARTDATRPASRMAAAVTVVGDAVTGMVLGAEEEVEPASVVEIPILRLMLSHLLSRTTIFLLVLIGIIVWGSWETTPWLLFSVIPAVIGVGAYWMRSLAKKFRYAIAPTPNGVRITYGLFTTITEILPPGRVHAIEVSQPLLWRPAGWWAIRVNRLSGKGGGGRESEQFADALPVGDRADVERVLGLLMPDLPADEWPLVFEHGILRRGTAKQSTADPYTTTPRRALILRPLSWRRNGFRVTDDALFLRRGAIWRDLAVFPLARLQSVGIEQGPIDRALGVAAAHAHTITGRVSGRLGAIDRDAAVALFAAAEAGAVRAGAADRSHRWAGAEPDDVPGSAS